MQHEQELSRLMIHMDQYSEDRDKVHKSYTRLSYVKVAKFILDLAM